MLTFGFLVSFSCRLVCCCVLIAGPSVYRSADGTIPGGHGDREERLVGSFAQG